NEVTSQWCAQAKSKTKGKKKSKKQKKNQAKKDKKKAKASKKSGKKNKLGQQTSVASPLVSVPTIGKTAAKTVVPQQNSNALLAVGIPKGVSNEVLNYQAIRVNFNPSLRIPNCVALWNLE
ncbi:MAG: hypothetical protein II560_03710, partial [Bacteroidales bacterium]|nr:hypothetical protein [Bacteroidales bacterium]